VREVFSPDAALKGRARCLLVVGLRFAISRAGGFVMMTILFVILVLALLGSVPAWPHSRDWGYAPSGTLTLVVLILVLMMASGRL
jgi:hypothetical protein